MDEKQVREKWLKLPNQIDIAIFVNDSSVFLNPDSLYDLYYFVSEMIAREKWNFFLLI